MLSELRSRYQISRNAGRLLSALKTLETIKRFVPPNCETNDERLFGSWFYSELGYLYQDLGDIEKAIAAFEQSLEIDSFSYIEGDLARLKLGIEPDEEFMRVIKASEE